MLIDTLPLRYMKM